MRTLNVLESYLLDFSSVAPQLCLGNLDMDDLGLANNTGKLMVIVRTDWKYFFQTMVNI